MRRVVAITVCAGAALNLPAQTACDFSEVTALCNGALAGQNVDTPVPGFDLLLMHRGQTVYHQAFGAWTLNRVANADSSTKTLSGALILSLTDDTPLSLDSRLGDFLPEFTGVKGTITVRQAFAHMAGVRESSAVSSQTLTLRQAVAQIAGEAQLFEPGLGIITPGEAFSYGGSSMHAAGAAAEVAAGAPWNTLFAQRISGPGALDLPNTRFVLTSAANPRIAGGCESTAAEFGRFMEMLRVGGVWNGRRILSESAVAQMFQRQTPQPVPILGTPVQTPPFADGADYGVGVWLVERDEQGLLRTALAAGARGFASWIDFDDQLVGVFATDVSQSGNLQTLYTLLFRAAERAVRGCACDSVDFNHDGLFPDTQDIDDFLSVFSGGTCSNDPDCGDIDFNNDGLFPDTLDIDALLSVFSGGACVG